jgi:hypothetical protein
MTTHELSNSPNYLPGRFTRNIFIALIVVLYASAIAYTMNFYPSQIFVVKKCFNSAIIYLQNDDT